MSMIIGHSKIIKFFDRCIEKGTLSHAYIFSGPEQVGKFTVAVNLAEKILSGNVILGDNLIIVKSEIEEEKGIIKKKDIVIEQVRDLQHSLNLSSGVSAHRIAIIDEADRMNHKAQNAFLKTLEEANEGVILILIARDEKKMLTTIASRCQKIKFGIVPDCELEVGISGETKNKQELISLSAGRPGLLLNFINNDSELLFHKETLQELKRLFSQSVGERFELAEKMSKDVGMAEKKMNLWIAALRSVVLGQNAADKIDRLRALKLIEGIEESIGFLHKNNFNSRLLLENLFLNI